MDIRHIITVFITSLTPVLELRGGMLLARSLNLPWWVSFLTCVIGSTLLGVLTFFLGEIIIKILKIILPKYIEKLEEKKETLSQNYEKWGYTALTLFVGIPLPGTGAFTGALIAGLLEFDTKKSIISLLLGNILAAFLLSLFFLIR